MFFKYQTKFLLIIKSQSTKSVFQQHHINKKNDFLKYSLTTLFVKMSRRPRDSQQSIPSLRNSAAAPIVPSVGVGVGGMVPPPPIIPMMMMNPHHHHY